jgi:hypothetical protein
VVKLYGLEEYLPRLESLQLNLEQLGKFSEPEVAAMLESLAVLPEHSEAFARAIHSLRRPSEAQDNMPIIRSFSLKNRATMQEPVFCLAESIESKEPLSAGTATSRDTKVARNAFAGEVGETSVLRELEEGRLKLRQLEVFLHAKGGLQVIPVDDIEDVSSPPVSGQSDFFVTPSFTATAEAGHVSQDPLSFSYDSLTMRATLTSLDIDEICSCLAKAILKQIHTSLSLRHDLCTSHPDLFEEFTPLHAQRERVIPGDQDCSVMGKEDDFTDAATTHHDSSPRMADYAVKSFKDAFDDSNVKVGSVPAVGIINSFCKNVIVRCKMVPEASIACLVYLERLVTKTGLRINEQNWRRLLFTALVLASKTWDDESPDNQHFSKAFSIFSVREISQMESVLLTLIDNSLVLKDSDYAKHFFILRTYTEQKQHSFAVKDFEERAVRRL